MIRHEYDRIMDNWKHRSKNMRCVSCMWFCPKHNEDKTVSAIGRCRRHAPTIHGGFPVVYKDDWCGDHKLDEAKAKADEPVRI